MRVLTLGTFDLFHPGHLRLLRRASKFGALYVGVNSDRFVETYKGRPPTEDEKRRLYNVAHTAERYVYRTCLNDGPGRDLIEELLPSLLVVGSDWLERDYLAQVNMTRRELDVIGCSVLFLPRTADVSTSSLRLAA